jgi:hypothetical protein
MSHDSDRLSFLANIAYPDSSQDPNLTRSNTTSQSGPQQSVRPRSDAQFIDSKKPHSSPAAFPSADAIRKMKQSQGGGLKWSGNGVATDKQGKFRLKVHATPAPDTAPPSTPPDLDSSSDTEMDDAPDSDMTDAVSSTPGIPHSRHPQQQQSFSRSADWAQQPPQLHHPSPRAPQPLIIHNGPPSSSGPHLHIRPTAAASVLNNANAHRRSSSSGDARTLLTAGRVIASRQQPRPAPHWNSPQIQNRKAKRTQLDAMQQVRESCARLSQMLEVDLPPELSNRPGSAPPPDAMMG